MDKKSSRNEIRYDYSIWQSTRIMIQWGSKNKKCNANLPSVAPPYTALHLHFCVA